MQEGQGMRLRWMTVLKNTAIATDFVQSQFWRGQMINRFLIVMSALSLFLPDGAKSADFHNQTLDDGVEAILIVGDIVEGDEEKFRQLSIRFPDAVVGLDSDGGQLVPALEIGRLIRLRGYQTAVLGNDTCASACALIWMGGSKRTLGSQANLGFHASYLDQDGRLVENGAANALVGRYLTQLNYSEDAVLFATLAPPEDIWWLNEETKNIAGIDFETYYSDPAPVHSPPPIRTVQIPPPLPPKPSLRSMLQSEGVAAKAATAMGATGALHAALADHLQKIYNDEIVVSRIETEMDAARIDFASNPTEGGAILFRLSNKLILNGMSRLSQADVNNFFYFFSAVSREEDATCDVTLADQSKVNLNEFRYIQSLGGNSLMDYLALLRKAIRAEAGQSPRIVTLQQDQVAIAEAAWSNVLLEAATKAGWSEQMLEAAFAAMDQPSDDNKIQRCGAVKVILPAVADMDGMAGDWFRRVYLTYIQDGQ